MVQIWIGSELKSSSEHCQAENDLGPLPNNVLAWVDALGSQDSNDRQDIVRREGMWKQHKLDPQNSKQLHVVGSLI